MQTSEMLAMMVIFPIFIGGILWIIHTIMEWRKFKQKLQFNSKLIDKFNNPEDLKEFLATGSGGKIFDAIDVKNQTYTTRDKLMGSLTKSIVLICLGCAFFIISYFKMLGGEAMEAGAFGIIAIALGLGFLISTALSFKLSQKWGIIEEE